MKKNKQYILLSTLVSAPLVFGVMSSSRTSANSVVDSVSIKVPIACTLSGSISSGNEHNATISNGVYKTDIGTTNLKIVCNDNSGFSLYAVGFTDDIQGKTTMSSSINSLYDIATGTAESGNASNWAMKISAESNALYDVSIENGFDNYSSVPSRFTKIAARSTGTDAGQLAFGANLTTTYAAYISKTQPSGSYIGQVKYTLVHPHNLDPPQEYETESGYIGYYPNATSYVGTMERQAIQQTDTMATLSAPKYSREGYGFAGWNDKYDYTGNYYGPNEDIVFEAGAYSGGNKGLSLYAIWIKSEGDIQNWSGCTSMQVGNVTALTDSRDGNTYAIAKLADEKCWTIENIRIGDSTTETPLASGSDSLGSGFSALPSSSNSWVTISTSPQFNSINLSEDATFSYGGYYSWPAVIASSSELTFNNQSANTSICPAGWHLPRGGQTTVNSTADYYILAKSIFGEEPNQNLSTGYGYYIGRQFSDLIRHYPNNFVYSGYWDGDSPDSRGSSGFYWTSTANDSGNAYYLYINDDIVRPGNGYNNKHRGSTFRCITNNS